MDGPAWAIRAAHAIRAELAEHGLQVRVGLHTGEVELVGDDIGGIAVHIAARVLGQAGAGEIVCSRTVKDLVAGAGFAFTDANHRPESRSHRTCRRLKQPSHDSDRSTFQRCRPGLPAIFDPGGAGRSRR